MCRNTWHSPLICSHSAPDVSQAPAGLLLVVECPRSLWEQSGRGSVAVLVGHLQLLARGLCPLLFIIFFKGRPSHALSF